MALKIAELNNRSGVPPCTPGNWSGAAGYRGIPVATAAAIAMQRRLTARGLLQEGQMSWRVLK